VLRVVSSGDGDDVRAVVQRKEIHLIQCGDVYSPAVKDLPLI
jgi:hypothetical protein